MSGACVLSSYHSIFFARWSRPPCLNTSATTLPDASFSNVIVASITLGKNAVSRRLGDEAVPFARHGHDERRRQLVSPHVPIEHAGIDFGHSARCKDRIRRNVTHGQESARTVKKWYGRNVGGRQSAFAAPASDESSLYPLASAQRDRLATQPVSIKIGIHSGS